MYSREGWYFQRYMEAFIRPGRQKRTWSKHSNMVAWGLLPTAEDEISVYFTQHYYSGTANLRRGGLRTDGFVSLHAPYNGGQFITKPLVFSGDELVVNAETGETGSIRVEIQDAVGRPLEGYGLQECSQFFGEEIDYIVSWAHGSDVSSLADRPLRLRFVMQEVGLYSFQFRPSG